MIRRLAIITIVLFFGCSFNSSSAQEATLERASVMLKHGAYKEAIATYTTLLQKNPSDHEALEGLTRAQIETGEYQTAEKRVKAFLNEHPLDAIVRCSLGDIELQTGRYPEAAADFARAAKDGNEVATLRAN